MSGAFSGSLPEPISETPMVATDGLLRRAVQNAIAQGDADQVVRLLACADEVHVAVAIRALWLPVAEELSSDGSTLDGDGRLGQLLRQQIRAALLRESQAPFSRWLVPARLADTTAVHLAALVLTRHGMGARIWPWPLPAPGPALVVGDDVGECPGHDHIPIRTETRAWPPLAALVA